MNQYIHIGKIAAVHGVIGQVILVHSLGKKANFKKAKALFVEEIKNTRLPYFVESSIAKSNTESYVQLEGIKTREAAQRLLSKKIWLSQEDFELFVAKNAPIHLLDYEVVWENNIIGKVQETIEQPHQVLLRIDYNGKEAYIPLHEESLLKINHKTKQVIVNLPEGLLDIYK